MDEVETFAKASGLRFVLADKVENKFLREKFARRGYVEIPYSWRHPDYLLDLQTQ